MQSLRGALELLQQVHKGQADSSNNNSSRSIRSSSSSAAKLTHLCRFRGSQTMRNNNNNNKEVGGRVLQQVQHACKYPVNVMGCGVRRTKLSNR